MAKKNLLSDVVNLLLFQKKMKPIDLAREVDVPQPTMHRIVTGKSTNPHRSTLEPIAEYFDVTVEQLKGEAPLPDQAFARAVPVKSHGLIEIPLIDYADLPYQAGSTTVQRFVAAMSDLSPGCFAVLMNDSSMAPQFDKGTILILDPDKVPFDRCYALVGLDGGEYFVFRQLLMDADHQFLKPLNPDLTTFQMRLLGEEDEVLAVLVEARQVYSEML